MLCLLLQQDPKEFKLEYEIIHMKSSDFLLPSILLIILSTLQHN